MRKKNSLYFCESLKIVFSFTKIKSKCNSRTHCLHKMKAGDVPNGCGRYFMYKKINNYVDSLEIAESFIYVEIRKNIVSC